MDPEPNISRNKKQVLLIGSSHTSLSFFYVKKRLDGKANVSKLPYFAGNTEEMLVSLPGWPLEGKRVVYVYAGLRDLVLNEMGCPTVGPGKFRRNLEAIYDKMVARCSAKIIFSNIPPVANNLVTDDLLINKRILYYNHIIEEFISRTAIKLHNFSELVLAHKSGVEKYLDGLHFTREFYKKFAENLAAFIMKIL